MTHYAHTKEDPLTKQTLPKSEWQPLSDHLHNVACLAEKRASKFGAGKLGQLLGLTHDLGKYSVAFQNRLEGKVERVDHASAGAQEVSRRYGAVGKAMAYVIAGHHGGMPDGNMGDASNLPGRLAKEVPPYADFREEITLPAITPEDLAYLPQGKTAEMNAYSLSFCIRMLFSCLVDADYLDTERFMQPKKFQARPKPISLLTLWNRFEKTLDDLDRKGRAHPSSINDARREILNQCLRKAEGEPGLFTLTVPTGGGKTYSSLAFALKHAVLHADTPHKKDRIIYVIPYTSIIEQNTQVMREAMEESGDVQGVVLEHHSNYEYPETPFDAWDTREKAHRLGTENWDMPVVVTTAVQFFESLYANKGSRCRKLHNIANSIIILDEAQMMPMDFLKPCLWALTELVLNYGVTVVLCTATQPAIKDLLPQNVRVTEIMDSPETLQKVFKRVEATYVGSMTDKELAEAMAGHKQVLTIVNTRRHARGVFDELSQHVQTGIYHLSARMCPIHRKTVLDTIRKELKKGECRVISTQLIEAGVDVDFPAVYRSEAGLDSIAQAAGRCNREGRLRDGEGRSVFGKVVIFEPEKHGRPKQFDAVAGIMRDSVLRRAESFAGDILSNQAIEAYFRMLFHQERDNLDAQEILRMIDEDKVGWSFPFAEIGRRFQLIDNPMVSVVIPYDERARSVMDEVRNSDYPLSKARLLQPYTVQIYTFELDGLLKAQAVEQQIGNDVFFLMDKYNFYDDRFGLKDAQDIKAPSKDILVF